MRMTNNEQYCRIIVSTKNKTFRTMSKISEQKALEAFPLPKEEPYSTSFINQETFNSAKRTGYIVGYDQAFKDFMEKAEEFFTKNMQESPPL